MNKYTCTKCGVVSVIQSNEDELHNVACGCGKTPVTLKKGTVIVAEPSKQNVVPTPNAPIPAGASKPEAPKVFNPSQTVGTITKK